MDIHVNRCTAWFPLFRHRNICARVRTNRFRDDYCVRTTSDGCIPFGGSLSIKTVSTYRSRILEKMRLKSNSDLVKYILLHDLAPGGNDPVHKSD